MKSLIRSGLVIVAYIATLVVNALANILPFNGITTAEVSDSFAVYFVPAGYVFSIWGLIYLALGGYAVYQALAKQQEKSVLDKVGILFIISCIANCVWLVLWHYGYIYITVPVMLILLISLILIYEILYRDKSLEKNNVKTKLFIIYPFSIYLGWITVATIANITDALHALEWRGLGINAQIWAVILMIVAEVIALTMIIRRNDCLYPLVIIWAIIGIGVKFWNIDLLKYASLVVSAGILIALLIRFLKPPQHDTLKHL